MSTKVRVSQRVALDSDDRSGRRGRGQQEEKGEEGEGEGGHLFCMLDEQDENNSGEEE